MCECRRVQPWGSAKAALGLPNNAATSRAYSGINVLVLWGAVIEQGFPTQQWLTFRQALALGGHVRKGECGTTIFYADRFTPRAELERVAREGGEPTRPAMSSGIPKPRASDSSRTANIKDSLRRWTQ